MKSITHQPRAMTLAIALALGMATIGTGCAEDYGDADTELGEAAVNDGTLDAVTENSVQPVNDTWITTKVSAELATMEGVDNTELGVETSNGVVTLTGVAASEAAVKAMSAAAMRVDGVTKVNTFGMEIGDVLDDNMDMDMDGDAGMGVNDDMVEGDAYAENDESMDAATQNSDQPVEDTWITTKVLAKLQTIDDLDNTDIAVETSNGIVTLSGRADSQAMIDMAVAAAMTIEGVSDVDTSMLKIGTDAAM